MIRASFAALMLSASLMAAVPASANDPRLVERLYDAAEIVRINGKVNVQSTIRFGEGEKIENVAIGNSTAWQVTPNRRANLLFVKPLSTRATTNMTVVTNRHTYLFDLIASPATRNPLYILTFTYPAMPETEAEDTQLTDGSPPPSGANAIELAAANDDLAVVDPSALNFQWASSGNASLLPEQVYDDGNATFLSWPADTNMPAILMKNHEGSEGPVNFAVRGEMIVLDSVPDEIILRSGDDVATLVNQSAVSGDNSGNRS